MRPRSRRSARGTHRARSRWRKRPEPVARPVQRPGAAASSWARPPHRKWWAKRWDWRCRIPRWPPAASRSGWRSRGKVPSRWSNSTAGHLSVREHRDSGARSATPWWCMRRVADRRICCCTCRPSPTRPGCTRPTVEDWIDSQPQRAATGGCLAQRTGESSHGARVPGRRRAGSHAASARTRICWISMC